MPDRTNKVRIRFPDPKKHLKSGIIHDRVKAVAILFFFFKMAAPKNQNCIASNRLNNAKFNSQMQKWIQNDMIE